MDQDGDQAPDQALDRLDRRALFRRLLEPFQVARATMSEDGDLLSCRVCGAPALPRALLEHVVRRSGMPVEQVLLCPRCKRGEAP